MSPNSKGIRSPATDLSTLLLGGTPPCRPPSPFPSFPTSLTCSLRTVRSPLCTVSMLRTSMSEAEGETSPTFGGKYGAHLVIPRSTTLVSITMAVQD